MMSLYSSLPLPSKLPAHNFNYKNANNSKRIFSMTRIISSVIVLVQVQAVLSSQLSSPLALPRSRHFIFSKSPPGAGPAKAKMYNTNHEDVIQKFQTFFHSKQHSPIQRFKRQLVQFYTVQQKHKQEQQQQQDSQKGIGIGKMMFGNKFMFGNVFQTKDGTSATKKRCRTKFTLRPPMSHQSIWLDMFDISSPTTKNTNTGHHHHHHHHHQHHYFNHDRVGLTFPFISLDQRELKGNHNTDGDTDTWFPPTTAQVQDAQKEKPIQRKKRRPLLSSLLWSLSFPSSSSFSSTPWIIKRYTKRIGYGKECYESVKDCILNWEFHDGIENDCGTDRITNTMDRDHNHNVNNYNSNHAGYDDNSDHDVLRMAAARTTKSTMGMNKNANANANTNNERLSLIPESSTSGIIKALPPPTTQSQPPTQPYQHPLQHHQPMISFRRNYDSQGSNLIDSTAMTSSKTLFASSSSSTSTSSTSAVVGIEENKNPNILQITDTTGNNNINIAAALGRKLVTYTKRQILPFISPVYVLNPVCVVYDIIDEEVDCPMSCSTFSSGNSNKNLVNAGVGQSQGEQLHNQRLLFTSTAYGTLNGHLLTGEERVTVVYREENDIIDIGTCAQQHSSALNGVDDVYNRNAHGGAVDVEIISYSRPSSSVLGRIIYPFIGRMQNDFFESELEYIKGSYALQEKKMDMN